MSHSFIIRIANDRLVAHREVAKQSTRTQSRGTVRVDVPLGEMSRMSHRQDVSRHGCMHMRRPIAR